MDVSEIYDRLTNLKRVRMQYSPYKYLTQLVATTRDIYNERHSLKVISFENKSIDYVVSIIVDDLYNDGSFRRGDCLNIVKRMISNRRSKNAFNKELMEKLFYMYQTFVFSGNEEIRSTVSACIKDQPLTDDQLNWLVENYQRSEQITNCLLSYPFKHELVTEWARSVLHSNELQNRLPEIIGILIDEDIPEGIDVDNGTIMWSIYYSKCTKSQKRKLMLKYLDYQDYSEAIEAASRLGIVEISKALFKHYRGLIKSSSDADIFTQ